MIQQKITKYLKKVTEAPPPQKSTTETILKKESETPPPLKQRVVPPAKHFECGIIRIKEEAPKVTPPSPVQQRDINCDQCIRNHVNVTFQPGSFNPTIEMARCGWGCRVEATGSCLGCPRPFWNITQGEISEYFHKNYYLEL